MAKFIPFDQRCEATVNRQAYYTGIAMRSSTRRAGCERKAGKGMTQDEYYNAAETAIEARHGRGHPPCTLPPLKQLERGGIVGSVEIADCVSISESPWFFGDFGFVLREPKILPFLPYKGQLGFFDVPYGDKHA